MAPRKKYYGTTEEYERKLDRVMKRFEVSDYRYDWNRESTYVEFCYHGQWYHFENNFGKAKNAEKKTHKSISIRQTCLLKLSWHWKAWRG